MARALTATFAGIRPGDMPAFLVAQVTGALLALVTFRGLSPASQGERAAADGGVGEGREPGFAAITRGAPTPSRGWRSGP